MAGRAVWSLHCANLVYQLFWRTVNCAHTQRKSSLLKFVAGVIVVEKNHNLCVEGTVITPEQAKLLVSLEACNQLCSLPLCDTEIVRNEDCDIWAGFARHVGQGGTELLRLGIALWTFEIKSMFVNKVSLYYVYQLVFSNHNLFELYSDRLVVHYDQPTCCTNLRDLQSIHLVPTFLIDRDRQRG